MFIALLLALMIFSVSAEMSDEEKLVRLKLLGKAFNYIKECQKGNDIPDSIVQGLVEQSLFPKFEDAKCLTYCVFDGLEVLLPSGDVDNEKMKKFVSVLFGISPHLREVSAKLWESCYQNLLNENIQGNCERSHYALECCFTKNQVASPDDKLPSLSQLE